MQLSDFKKIILPEAPGVYFFKKGKDLLYIGKATNLKDRVRSYFSADLIKTRGVLLVDMITKATSITYEETSSVLEALLRETSLIKKHQPYYNTKEKDNKSYSYIAITKEDYPAVLVVRGRDLEQKQKENPEVYLHTFGPFVSGVQLKEVMRIVRKLFPYRDEKCKPLSGKPCFNASIGLCPGVCTGRITQKEYASMIRKIALFLEGNTDKVLGVIQKEMAVYIKKQMFEEADVCKKKIYALTHIQDVALLKRETTVGAHTASTVRIEAYDIAHMQGKSMVGVMVVSENGQLVKDQYRKFIINTVSGANDPAALREVLQRRFAHMEWNMPQVIVVDGNEVQQRVVEDVCRSIIGVREAQKPIVVSVVKDERHKARAVLTAELDTVEHLKKLGITKEDIIAINAESHRFAIQYFRKKQRKDVYLQ